MGRYVSTFLPPTKFRRLMDVGRLKERDKNLRRNAREEWIKQIQFFHVTNAPRPHHPAHNTYLMNLCRTRLLVIFPFFIMSYYAALLLLHHHRRYNDNSRCFSSLCGGQISPARRNLIDTDQHHRSSLFDVSLLPGSGSVPGLSLFRPGKNIVILI